MRKAATLVLAVAAALVAAYLLYWKLPLGGQVQAEFSGLDLEFRSDVSIRFIFVLNNSGAIPCTLPIATADFFVHSRRNNAMRNDANITWPTGLRLPPKQRLEAAVILTLPYSSDFTSRDADSKEKTRTFVEHALADVEGFYVQGTLQCSSVTMDMPLRTVNP